MTEKLPQNKKNEKRLAIERMVDWGIVKKITDDVISLMKQNESKVSAQQLVLRGLGRLSADEYSVYCSAIGYRMSDLKKMKGIKPEARPRHKKEVREIPEQNKTLNWWDEEECTPEVEAVILYNLQLIEEEEGRGADRKTLIEMGYLPLEDEDNN